MILYFNVSMLDLGEAYPIVKHPDPGTSKQYKPMYSIVFSSSCIEWATISPGCHRPPIWSKQVRQRRLQRKYTGIKRKIKRNEQERKRSPKHIKRNQKEIKRDDNQRHRGLSGAQNVALGTP